MLVAEFDEFDDIFTFLSQILRAPKSSMPIISNRAMLKIYS